jgi:hypothetical protein
VAHAAWSTGPIPGMRQPTPAHTGAILRGAWRHLERHEAQLEEMREPTPGDHFLLRNHESDCGILKKSTLGVLYRTHSQTETKDFNRIRRPSNPQVSAGQIANGSSQMWVESHNLSTRAPEEHLTDEALAPKRSVAEEHQERFISIQKIELHYSVPLPSHQAAGRIKRTDP